MLKSKSPASPRVKLQTERDGCWFVVIGQARGRKAHSRTFAISSFQATGLIKRYRGKQP
jgi:hypothetical protein